MNRLKDTLGRVRVAVPCEEDWDEMRGDERVRFCARCSQNVYNLSAMTRREAERLVIGAEGRLCVRFYRREDGTMLTRNCPVGLVKLKRRVSRVASAAAAAGISFFAGVGVAPDAVQGTTYEATADAPAPAASMPAYEQGDAATAEAFTMSEGAMTLYPADLIIPGGMLAALVALFLYPVVKIVSWWGEKRRASLSILPKP